MAYVAMIGLLFFPIVFLMSAALFYVRWQNEHEDEEQALKNKKAFKVCLIAAAISLVVFGVLKIVFPFC